MKRLKTKKPIIIGGALAIALLTGGAVFAVIAIISPTEISYANQTATTMQTFTKAMCDGMDTYSTQVLTDTRNNQDYRVRKMPDGRCWMVDNLKLATPGSSLTLTPADSDVATNFTIPANPVQGSSTHGNGTCVDGTTSATGTFLTCDGTSAQSDTNNPFIAYTNPADTENTLYFNCTRMNGISPDSLTGCGYLYNWYTATAGTGTYAMATGEAPSSICPAGWKLPKYSPNEFGILNNAMATGQTTSSTTSNATTRPNWRHNGPFEGSLAGYYDAGFSGAGYAGHYWSSAALSFVNALSLAFNFSDVYPGVDTLTKDLGYSVRCLF